MCILLQWFFQFDCEKLQRYKILVLLQFPSFKQNSHIFCPVTSIKWTVIGYRNEINESSQELVNKKVLNLSRLTTTSTGIISTVYFPINRRRERAQVWIFHYTAVTFIMNLTASEIGEFYNYRHLLPLSDCCGSWNQKWCWWLSKEIFQDFLLKGNSTLSQALCYNQIRFLPRREIKERPSISH